MNEALQGALAALIGKLTETVSSVGGVVADQIPELVNQMIGFRIMKYWIWFSVELFVFIVMPYVIFRTVGLIKRKIVEHEEAARAELPRTYIAIDDDGCWGVGIVMAVIWVAAAIGMVNDVVQLVKLYNFPLVWVLDYVKDLAAK